MILIKISDIGCNVCKYFSQFDSLIAAKKRAKFLEISLNNLGNFPEIYLFVLENYVDSEGFVDVPLFILQNEEGKVLEHFSGKMETSSTEFQKRLFSN